MSVPDGNGAKAAGEADEAKPSPDGPQSERWRPSYLPAAIIALYAAFALFAAWIIRLDYGPDEPYHVQYAYEIAVNGRLRNPTERMGNLIRTHPPLYYLILAGIWRATSARQSPIDTLESEASHEPITPRTALARRLMRCFSVLLGCLTLVVVARLLVVIGIAPEWRPFMLAAFALWPSFQWISSVISNDNVAILLSVAACLAVVSRLRAGSTTLKQAVLLGLLVGLGAWAKRPTLFVVPIAAWAVFATSPKGRRADFDVARSAETPDFSSHPVAMRADMIDWPVARRDVLMKVADDPQYGHRHYKQRAIDRGRAALMRKPDGGSGDCSFVVHHALSWHPDYAGSSLEIAGSSEVEERQGWDGSWTGNSPSYMLSLLERFSTPVAALAVLRSVPLLIGQQGADACWDESRSAPLRQPGGKPCPWSALPKETSTFMIIRALRKFGFLDRLRPG